MFCKNCGHQMDDNAKFCPTCGTHVLDDAQAQVDVEVVPASNANGSAYLQPSNTLAIVGFVFSFLMPLIGLICSIIAYKNASNYEVQYKGLALAGIIISICEMFLIFIIVIPVSCIVFAALA